MSFAFLPSDAHRSMQHAPRTTRASGFTLVEIAIVVTVIGVLLGSGLLALNGVLNDVRNRTTRERINSIANALSVYAQQNYFLPCPAEPNTINGQQRATCGNYTDATGIVPYATLGLRREQVIDAFGNFIRYVVNPSYATQATVQLNNNVNEACRTDPLWIMPGPINKNPRKARFCCASTIVQDIVINDQNNQRIVPVTMRQNTGQNLVTAGPNPPNLNNEAVAMVLVSHGKNMYGAFTESGNQITSAAANRPDEVQNDGLDNTYLSRDMSSSDADYYDDIIAWRTQDQLISAFGRDSCARP